MIEKFGNGVYATVMDSYDYDRALNKVVPTVSAEKNKKGGLWVFRPDSGDPVEVFLFLSTYLIYVVCNERTSCWRKCIRNNSQ